jgi:DNA polymerase-4
MTALLEKALRANPSTALNTAEPSVMHVDLNSCFATVEQQARPSLRGKPLGVTNRISPHCCMIALSYEAKKVGAKVGMRYDEVKAMIPDLIVLETDPPKYHHAYEKLMEIMKSYSPHVKMKSIDEGVIDFRGTRNSVNTRPLAEIGREIKQRLRDELGCWMKCNIGIAPNRFLAKLAAGFNKPDGLTVIDHTNLEERYRTLKLTDLPGIADRFQRRLNNHGIITPIDFLNAPIYTLHKNVFESVVGVHWHQRIRGYEVDDVETNLGIVGRQFALDVKTTDAGELEKRFAYLCYTTARKLRYNNVAARGVHVYLGLRPDPGEAPKEPFVGGGWQSGRGGTSWFKRHLFPEPFYTDRAVFENAMLVFNQRPKKRVPTLMSITCYHLSELDESSTQLELFRDIARDELLTDTMDDINEVFGNPTIMMTPALGAHSVVKQKIPFGSTKYFELLNKRA